MTLVLDHDVHRPGAQHRHSKGVFDRFGRAHLAAGGAGRMLLATPSPLPRGLGGHRQLGLASVPPHGGPLGVVTAVALLLVFALQPVLVWTAVGLRMSDTGAVMQMSMTVLFPVTFASNVFVDPRPCPAGCSLRQQQPHQRISPPPPAV